MMLLAKRIASGGAIVCAMLVGMLVIGVPVPIDERIVLRPPSANRAVPRDVIAQRLRTPDGGYVETWSVLGRRGMPWVLLNYGNAADLRGTLPVARWFARTTGATAVMWDYPGFGMSSGRPDIRAIRHDALLLYDDIRARSGVTPWVYGVSFGTTVAAWIAHERIVRGTILHAPPADAISEFTYGRDRWFPWPLRRLRPAPTDAVRDAFAVAATLRAVRTPLLVLHGTDDTLIPIAHGRRVFRESGSREKEFVAIPHAGHGDVRYDATPAGAAIAAFVRRNR